MKFDPIRSLADMRHEFGEHGGVNMSIETSTAFTVMDPETLPEIFLGQRGPDRGGCFLYGRHFNPTVYVLGRQIAALEGAEAGYCAASGMAAISATIHQLCSAGDHIVSSATVYGGTFALFHDYMLAKSGIEVTFVDPSDLDAVADAITEYTRVLYIETLANPTLRVANIPALAQLAKERGIKLVVDNTFSPLIVSPIQLGADVVVHSLTKFMNGASGHRRRLDQRDDGVHRQFDGPTRGFVDAARPDAGPADRLRHQHASAAPRPTHRRTLAPRARICRAVTRDGTAYDPPRTGGAP